MLIIDKYLSKLNRLLKPHNIVVTSDKHGLHFSSAGKKIDLILFEKEDTSGIAGRTIPFDIFVNNMEKVTAVVRSRLGLNKTIFARKTEVKKIPKDVAEEFLNAYHIMGATGSAFNYGLFSGEELMAVAAFSKGRKMDRLPSYKRSFELIRFCTKSGITVSGGLSKLIKHFIREKDPGDIMTYVDKQFADGNSFIKMGFQKMGETEPVNFLVDRKTRVRKPISGPENYDEKKYYLARNNGNIKLVFVVAE